MPDPDYDHQTLAYIKTRSCLAAAHVGIQERIELLSFVEMTAKPMLPVVKKHLEDHPERQARTVTVSFEELEAFAAKGSWNSIGDLIRDFDQAKKSKAGIPVEGFSPYSLELKKNLANKIFGYLARCEGKFCI